MSVAEGPIEDTVELSLLYPSVSERYFTKHYFIPKVRKKTESSTESHRTTNKSQESGAEEGSSAQDCNGHNRDAANGAHACGPEDGAHTCVMVHTNKLCLVTLSHLHPILAKKKTVTEISFDVGKMNRLENQVSGKGKRGAQLLGPESPMCNVSCSDGTKYTILAGVQGKLVEVNSRLLPHPELLTTRPHAEGYLAVVLPPLRNGAFKSTRLLTEEQYEELGQSCRVSEG